MKLTTAEKLLEEIKRPPIEGYETVEQTKSWVRVLLYEFVIWKSEWCIIFKESRGKSNTHIMWKEWVDIPFCVACKIYKELKHRFWECSWTISREWNKIRLTSPSVWVHYFESNWEYDWYSEEEYY